MHVIMWTKARSTIKVELKETNKAHTKRFSLFGSFVSLTDGNSSGFVSKSLTSSLIRLAISCFDCHFFRLQIRELEILKGLP